MRRYLQFHWYGRDDRVWDFATRRLNSWYGRPFRQFVVNIGPAQMIAVIPWR